MAENVSEPGIHPTVDGEAATHLIAQYKSEIESIKDRGKTWSYHLDEYRRLQNMLRTLSHKVTYSSTKIPMGKKAYFEGELVHTNEIMVLLGDNWFVERSALQASEICQRRIDKCTEMLENLDKELTLVESWCREASNIANPDSGNFEIREPYDEKAEAEWKVKHREAVAKHKSSDKPKSDVVDESLFERLDELELEEELDEHLEKEKLKEPSPEVVKDPECDAEDDSEASGEDWSESPDLTDSEENDSSLEGNCRNLPKTEEVGRFDAPEGNEAKCSGNESESDVLPYVDAQGGDHLAKIKPRRRRVSFGSISERLFRIDSDEPVSDVSKGHVDDSNLQSDNHDNNSDVEETAAKNCIYISHHPDDECFNENDNNAPSVPNDPSDLLRIYGGGSPSRLKSILKPAGSSHSLTSIDEETAPRSSFFGRFSISPTKSFSSDLSLDSKVGSPGNGSGRFSVSPVKTQPVQEVKVNPVCDTVVERDELSRISNDLKISEQPQKQSRFKLSRINQS